MRPLLLFWTPPTDETLLPEVGVDAVLYIKLTRLCLHLLLCTAGFDLAAVLPANVAGGAALGPASDIARLTMAHVPDGSAALWVHFVSVLLKTGALLALTYRVRARRSARFPLICAASFVV
jgi:hypothetical protein